VCLLSLPGTALSKEALDKMGIGVKSLTKEEEQAKVKDAVIRHDFNC